MFKRLIFGGVAAAVLVPLQASAQVSGEAVIYDRGNFKGRSLRLDGAMRFPSAFTAKSIRVPEGQAWELCSGNRFTGCREFNRSSKAMVVNVRSARPVAAVIRAIPPGSPIAATGAVGGGPWPALRGLASEYFVAPDVGGNRIEVTSGRSEDASQMAEDFCRRRGWRTSAHERLQSVGGRTYLADVLCSEARE